jgi:hypothetical protein
MRAQNVLYQEIDYMNEGTNAELFRKNFEGTPWVKVPEIYWEKSGQRVLCMEYCPGLKINRVDEIERMGLDRTLLARYGVEAYLQQILRFGACCASAKCTRFRPFARATRAACSGIAHARMPPSSAPQAFSTPTRTRATSRLTTARRADASSSTTSGAHTTRRTASVTHILHAGALTATPAPAAQHDGHHSAGHPRRPAGAVLRSLREGR